VSGCWHAGRLREAAGGRESRNAIVRGLLRRVPGFYIVRAQDAQVSGEDDTVVLDWATRNDRAVLTHDVSTMISAMRELLRISRCAPIIFVPDSLYLPLR
jgi:Domain of unknown function (DUF5615)